MRIAIIGAGLAGLTAAYKLHQLHPEANIQVFEAAERIGGKLHTVAFQTGPVDMGAEAFVALRQDAVEFFTELGLADSLRSPSGLPSLLYSGGQTHAMPANTIMGIPASSKGLEGLVDEATCARIDAESQAPDLQWDEGDQSLGRVIRERYGDQVVDRVVSALQGGVYSSSSDDLGIRATVPELARSLDRLKDTGQRVTLSGAVQAILDDREARNKARGYKPAVFSTFAGGYAELYETLAEKSGAEIYVDCFISSVKRSGSQYVLAGAPDSTPVDYVMFATPAPTTAMLVREIAPELAAELKKIHLASSVVVGMRFATADGLPDNSGILVATDEPSVTAKAFTFSSKKWPHLPTNGGSLVRASFGRFGDDSVTRMDEDALVDLALDDLKTITGFDGREAGLEEIYLQRWFGGLPVYGPEHLETVAAAKSILAEMPNLGAVGAWVDGVGVPATISSSLEAAERLVR